ncbi:MAG: matrixin family metalloprotease [Myxococcota bacterium]
MRMSAVIALALASAFVGERASAFAFFLSSDSGDPVRWFGRDAPITVRVGTIDATVDLDAFVAAVQAAFDTWAAVDCARLPEFVIVRDDSVRGLTSPTSFEDPADPVVSVFSDASAPLPSPLTTTQMGVARVAHVPTTGEIVDSDIVLNAVDFPFSDGTTCAASNPDLEALLLHEVGHFLGLDESQVIGSAMGPRLGCGRSQRAPTQDDIDGVCALYAHVPAHREPGAAADDAGCAAGGALDGLTALAGVGAIVLLMRTSRRRRAHQAVDQVG